MSKFIIRIHPHHSLSYGKIVEGAPHYEGTFIFQAYAGEKPHGRVERVAIESLVTTHEYDTAAEVQAAMDKAFEWFKPSPFAERQKRVKMQLVALAALETDAWVRHIRDGMPERDNCQVCMGAKGGTKGNENVIDGVVTCDYCHAAQMPVPYTIREIDEAIVAILGPHGVRIDSPSWSRPHAMQAAAEKAWLTNRKEDDLTRALRAGLTHLERHGVLKPHDGFFPGRT